MPSRPRLFMLMLTLAVVLVITALGTVFVPPALASDPAPVGLTVSTAGAPIPAAPGKVTNTWLRIGNNGTESLPVSIAPATVDVGNDGVTRLEALADPLFAGNIVLSATSVTVPALSFTEIQVTITVPETLAPDIYILGFMVTPSVSGGAVKVLNQVGALISLDLPGPRDQRLEAAFLDAPLFHVTSDPSLTVRVRSVGRSALQFTSETTIDGFGEATPSNIRRSPQLLPASRYRDVTLNWNSSLGVGIHNVHVRVVYHRTQAETTEQSLTRTVIVLSPPALGILAVVLLIIIAAVITLISWRRRSRHRPQHSAFTKRPHPRTPDMEHSPRS